MGQGAGCSRSTGSWRKARGRKTLCRPARPRSMWGGSGSWGSKWWSGTDRSDMSVKRWAGKGSKGCGYLRAEGSSARSGQIEALSKGAGPEGLAGVRVRSERRGTRGFCSAQICSSSLQRALSRKAERWGVSTRVRSASGKQLTLPWRCRPLVSF